MEPAERHTLIADLFHEALELAPRQRPPFLRQRCAGDESLFREVASLLGADQASERAEEAAAAVGAEAAAVLDRAQEGPGARLGPYRLIRQIGEGGFGLVFLAEQESPVSRQVALKIIKLGMDTRNVLARFDAERQAMAMMDHPNIARALDAGSTESGRPYFVMELAEGEPITDYCLNRASSAVERLELFLQVCSAVQHAHQKGVIHRDLKPGNVLVTEIDGQATPKVIDFGVAKALRGRLTDRTVFTDLRQMIGTPQYMSPEQAEGSSDVDTRADLYALGAVLYEMLAGAAPFDAARLRSAPHHEVQRILREEDPPRPSHRRAAADDVARRSRGAGTLPADLDWIVMKCLEKDRSRRYETAEALAQDLRRWLSGEPVLAAPPSVRYRTGKLVRRHRVGATVAGVVLLTLVAGSTGVSVFAVREATARAEAQRREQETEQVARFQSRMLSRLDPAAAGEQLVSDLIERFDAALVREGLGDTDRQARVTSLEAELAQINARDVVVDVINETILRPAVDAIDDFASQPTIAAHLSQTLADLYRSLGLYDAAAPLQKQAVALRRGTLGEDHIDTITSINAAGLLLVQQGKLTEAEAFYEESLDRSQRVLGAEHTLTIKCLNDLGVLMLRLGRNNEAEAILRRTLETRRQALGDRHGDTLISINNLGYFLQQHGRLREAEPYSREALKLTRAVHGEDHPDTIIAMNNLSMLLKDLGELERAEELCREGLEKSRRVHGERSQPTLILLANLSTILQDQGRQAEAEPYCLETLEKSRAILGPDHPTTLAFVYNITNLMRGLGRLEEAEAYGLEALEGYRRTLGPEHPDTLSTMRVLGSLAATQGRPDVAEQRLSEALEIMRSALGMDHVETITAIALLGELFLELNRLDEAEPLLEEAVEHARQVLGARALIAIGARSALGDLRRRQGQLEEALAIQRAAEADYDSQLPPDAWRTLEARTRLGQALTAASHFEEAEEKLLAAEESLKALPGRQKLHRECAHALATLYDAWARAHPGRGYEDQAEAWRTAGQAG